VPERKGSRTSGFHRNLLVSPECGLRAFMKPLWDTK
jgi:hypothetical protein